MAAALEIWQKVEAEHWLPVVGRSMMPLLRKGDAVLVAHGTENLCRGDVIVFREKSGLVAHRLLHIEESDSGRVLVTKGDSRRWFDALVPAAEILGPVVAIQRGERHLRLDTPSWRAIGWLIAVATLFVTTPYRWYKALEQRLRTQNRPS